MVLSATATATGGWWRQRLIEAERETVPDGYLHPKRIPTGPCSTLVPHGVDRTTWIRRDADGYMAHTLSEVISLLTAAVEADVL